MSPTSNPVDLLDGYASLREQRYGGVLALAWELGRAPLQREVAELFGISRSYASSLMTDPHGERERSRKDGYRGTCERCGQKTDGSAGPGKAPKVCATCLLRDPDSAMRTGPRRPHRIWNEERCLDSIVRWVERNGRVPRVVDLFRAEEGERPCFGTIVKYCYRYELVVSRWRGKGGLELERRWYQLTRNLRDILVELAPRLPVAALVTARNAWLRMRFFEVIGIENIVREAGSRISSDEVGVLWRIERDEWPEPVAMVEVVNSTPEPDGTHKTYFLRVPPDTATPRGGIAWTFEMAEQEYELAVQT